MEKADDWIIWVIQEDSWDSRIACLNAVSHDTKRASLGLWRHFGILVLAVYD